jgi:uncharacterized protein YPO0396
MCVGSAPQQPQVVVEGPTRKELRKERKQEKKELKQIRKDSRTQAQEFQQQLQNQIDAAANQTQQLQQQIAEAVAPPVNTVLANNYAVTTQQQALPATAQTTEVVTPVRPQAASLRITPGATAVTPGAGLNIGA